VTLWKKKKLFFENSEYSKPTACKRYGTNFRRLVLIIINQK